MSDTVSVRDARTPDTRKWIEAVYRDYLDDLAPLATGVFPSLGEVGHSVPDQLKRWYADVRASPLVIMLGQNPVGFAMVARARAGMAGSDSDFRMAEFFIARAQRRLGVGRTAVQLIFDRFAGRWEITEYTRNPGAVRFWRRVVMLYTRGDFQERMANGEVRQTFLSGHKRISKG